MVSTYGTVTITPVRRPPAKPVKAVAPTTQRRAQSGQRQEALTSVKFPKGTRIIGFDTEYLAAATYFKTAGDAYRYYQNVTTEPNVIRLSHQTGEEAAKPAYTAFHDYVIFEVTAATPARGRARPGFYVAYGVMASARTAYRAGIDDFPLQNPATGKVRNKAGNRTH